MQTETAWPFIIGVMARTTVEIGAMKQTAVRSTFNAPFYLLLWNLVYPGHNKCWEVPASASHDN